jgi:hypothetical protein
VSKKKFKYILMQRFTKKKSLDSLFNSLKFLFLGARPDSFWKLVILLQVFFDENKLILLSLAENIFI